MSKSPVLTVDGPGGVGKGTLCVRLAETLGWHLLDSGAIYRLMALSALKTKVDFSDVDGLCALAAKLAIRFETRGSHQTVAVFLDNQEVTDEVRTAETGQAASKISGHAPLRQALLQCQQDFAKAPGLVADGRDMGTVVFPDAPLKIYLTAAPEIRAERRTNELRNKGISVNLAEILSELTERDKRDSERKVAPLKPAPDAVIIDTSTLSVQEVFDKAMVLVNSRFPSR